MPKTTDRIYYNTQKISFPWKYYQATLYLLGSTSFLMGSILYYPVFYTWLDAELWADIFFIFGSSCYFCAEGREWRHHLAFACEEMEGGDEEERFVFRQRKRYNKYFFVYMGGNVLYLVGCIFCIPSLDRYRLGIQLFLSGFGLLVCIELHKLFMLLRDEQSICQQIKADRARAMMEISGAVSEWAYFSGTLMFEWSAVEVLGLRLGVWGVHLYVLGGVASCVYSVIYFKKLLELQRESQGSLISEEKTGSRGNSGHRGNRENTDSKEQLEEKLI